MLGLLYAGGVPMMSQPRRVVGIRCCLARGYQHHEVVCALGHFQRNSSSQIIDFCAEPIVEDMDKGNILQRLGVSQGKVCGNTAEKMRGIPSSSASLRWRCPQDFPNSDWSPPQSDLRLPAPGGCLHLGCTLHQIQVLSITSHVCPFTVQTTD